MKAQTTSEESPGSSDEKAIVPVDSQADPGIEVAHIDFIFGDQQWKYEGPDLMVQILHSIVQLNFHAKSGHQQ